MHAMHISPTLSDALVILVAAGIVIPVFARFRITPIIGFILVGLLVGEVARRNDLRLDPKRLNETMRLIASTYEEPEQVIEMYRNDPQLMSGLQNRVMEEQVIDWIAERAQHTEQALSFQDAIRQ